MVISVTTWFIVATLALVTTSAQFIGGYSASAPSSPPSLKMRASVSDGSLSWELERRVGPNVSIAIDFPLKGDSDSGHYTVDYSDFDRFKRLVTTAFPEVQMLDGDLTDLVPYNEIFFRTLLEGKEVFFFRRALSLVRGTYVYDQGDRFQLTLTISSSVSMTFSCADAIRREQFSDLIVANETFPLSSFRSTNIQFLPAEDADYARFIRDVAESCPGSDLPTGGTPSFFIFSATPNRVYLQLQGGETKTLALDRVE
ncbi:hypothetical protein FOZ62_024729 [Perkinsus olseni]|uniref:Uncharacterized protein n=1 Tax=Perkinsus olseni TaxID=32597 RepID=A0A7J6QEC3_PEROL|nr:hypothetical protein FOZ62_024729 [Perkinsus olseni]